MAARSEWRLVTATHNLLKLHRHSLQAAAGYEGGPRSSARFRGTALGAPPCAMAAHEEEHLCRAATCYRKDDCGPGARISRLVSGALE
jgi:hypothetical protein